MTHYPPLIAVLVSGFLTLVLLISKAGKEIQDVPNERSLHETPTPRIGGVGLVAGILSGWAAMAHHVEWWFVLPVVLLFGVSLLDDVKNLAVWKRFTAHFVAAIILAWGSGLLMEQPWLAVLLVFGVAWMTNLYNFMDGADGLAGGMAFFGFNIFALASAMHGNEAQAMANVTIAAAAFGFLFHNFPPARVFMGDAGSIPLGFLAAAMGFWGWQSGTWPVWFPLLVFSPFIVDATVTLAKRTLRRARVTQAHREHYYQRLVQMGWSHRAVAVAEYVLMAAVGASAIAALRVGGVVMWSLLSAWVVIYVILMLAIDLRWKAHQEKSG